MQKSTGRPAASPRVYFTAVIDQEGIVVLKDVYAGVSGPVRASDLPADLSAADAWLAAEDFERTGEWVTRPSSHGLILQAELMPA